MPISVHAQYKFDHFSAGNFFWPHYSSCLVILACLLSRSEALVICKGLLKMELIKCAVPQQAMSGSFTDGSLPYRLLVTGPLPFSTAQESIEGTTLQGESTFYAKEAVENKAGKGEVLF